MRQTKTWTSVVIATGLMLVSTGVLAAEVKISDEARAHFTAGVNLLQDPDGARYEEAYREFKAAYAASPSWKILGNLGLSAMKLERDGEAIEAYRKYLAEGGKELEADERAQIERDLATLESGVVRLTLSSAPAGATVIDERLPTSGAPVQNAYPSLDAPITIGVRPGRHRLTARLSGHRDAVWEVELSPRQQLTYAFQLPATASETAPPPGALTATPEPVRVDESAGGGNGLRIASYVALGVGVVGVGAGTLFAVQAKGKYDDGNDLCPSFPCTLTREEKARRDELGEDGDRAKTLSIVGFAVGGVGLATGVTLFVLSGQKHSETARLEPFITPTGAGLRGAF